MLLSDDKISHLSHLILDGLAANRDVVWLSDREKVLREIKRTILHELQVEEEIDVFVRRKLSSYSRPPAEGSPEWDVLYRKFFAEELGKKKK